MGENVQVSVDNDITNTMQTRTYGEISLGSAGNMQGAYLFLSLLTWKIIRRRTLVKGKLAFKIKIKSLVGFGYGISLSTFYSCTDLGS